MKRGRYYRARSSSSSLLTMSSSSTSLYTIPETMSTDELHGTGSFAPIQQTSTLTRRPSWTAGDDSTWTVQSTRQSTGSIAAGAPATQWPTISRAVRKSHPLSLSSRGKNGLKPRPTSQTFADILGGLFQSPFTANNPSGVEQSSSSGLSGPYPIFATNKKRNSWA